MARLLNTRGSLGMLAAMLCAAAAISAQTFPTTTPPRVIKKADPTYTKEAYDAKYEGTVLLSAVVETDGTPSEITVVRGLGMGLNERAVECLKQWRFEPARNSLGPIPKGIRVEINFRLSAARVTP